MNNDAIWQAIDAQRRGAAALLLTGRTAAASRLSGGPVPSG